MQKAAATQASPRQALHPAVQAALLMVAASLGFSIMNALIRHGTTSLEPLQIVFLRNFFALLLMLPWLRTVGLAPLRNNRMRLYLWRAGISYLAMGCWFTALAFIPLAEAVSLTFTAPLFATAGAALILKEVVGIRRWTATLIGFAGVLIIVRPGFITVSWVAGLPILAAMFMAVATLLIKTLSRTEDSRTIVLYLNLFLTPLSLIPALWVWQWPDPGTLALLACIGAISVGSQILLTLAFARAEASIVIPFMYLQLPFVAAIGYFAFGELPDLWTVLGALVITASAIYIAQRESRISARQAAEAERTSPTNQHPPHLP